MWYMVVMVMRRMISIIIEIVWWMKLNSGIFLLCVVISSGLCMVVSSLWIGWICWCFYGDR